LPVLQKETNVYPSRQGRPKHETNTNDQKCKILNNVTDAAMNIAGFQVFNFNPKRQLVDSNVLNI